MTIYENKPGIFRTSNKIIEDLLENSKPRQDLNAEKSSERDSTEEEYMNSGKPFFEL